MSWADHAIKMLQAGKTATITPHGNSMKGKVDDGETVVLHPHKTNLTVGDIVLVKVKGNVYLHLIKAINGDKYQIGNNRGGINGWVGIQAIYGKAVQVGNKVLKSSIVLTPKTVDERRIKEIKQLVDSELKTLNYISSSPETLNLLQAIADLLEDRKDLEEYKQFCEDAYEDDLYASMDQWRDEKEENEENEENEE